MAGLIRPETTAVHEAGHAVVAHVLGVGVRQVELLEGGGGRTELDAASARRALIIAVAGEVAEQTCSAPEPEVAWRL